MTTEMRAAVLWLADRLRSEGAAPDSYKGKFRTLVTMEPDDMRDLGMLAVMRGTTPQKLASRMVADALRCERETPSDEAAQIMWGMKETSDAE